jgi:hypothetical protein
MGSSRFPVRRHPLAPIKAAVFLCGPVAVIAPFLRICFSPPSQEDAPGSLEVSLGRRRGVCAFTGVAARIESTTPAPPRFIIRNADAFGDRADPDVAIEYLPAFLFGLGGSGGG